jgi:hypothetical protein
MWCGSASRAPRPVPITVGDARTGWAAIGRDHVDGITGIRADDADWSWPPSAAVPYVGGRQFHTDDWAPASTVRRPWVRVGRWTLLYRRCA